LNFEELLAIGRTCAELETFHHGLVGCELPTAHMERLFKEHTAQYRKPIKRMRLANKVTAVEFDYDQEERRNDNVRTEQKNNNACCQIQRASGLRLNRFEMRRCRPLT